MTSGAGFRFGGRGGGGVCFGFNTLNINFRTLSRYFTKLLKTFSDTLPATTYHFRKKKKEVAAAGKPVLLVLEALYVISHIKGQKI